jgi:hypothetical protein
MMGKQREKEYDVMRFSYRAVIMAIMVEVI